jgi:DNA-binding Lrp family transcriptional regulator
MEGYALIRCGVRRAEDVAERVASLDGVVMAETITGPYDVVARVRRASEHDLVHCLEEEITAIPRVTRVIVCPLASHERLWEMGLVPAGATS